MFQSSASLSTGCNACSMRCLCRRSACFNPQPAFRLAATGLCLRTRPGQTRFNPQPAFRLAATPTGCGSSCAKTSFNPQPAFRLAATGIVAGDGVSVDAVSILSQPFDWLQPQQ